MKQTVEIVEDEEVLQTTTCTPKDIDKDPKGWKVAFQDELDSFERLDVMDPVPLNTLDTSTLDILPCKVVMVKKPQGDGTHRKKGRVVVCGSFQQVQPGEETCANTPSFPVMGSKNIHKCGALLQIAILIYPLTGNHGGDVGRTDGDRPRNEDLSRNAAQLYSGCRRRREGEQNPSYGERWDAERGSLTKRWRFWGSRRQSCTSRPLSTEIGPQSRQIGTAPRRCHQRGPTGVGFRYVYVNKAARDAGHVVPPFRKVEGDKDERPIVHRVSFEADTAKVHLRGDDHEAKPLRETGGGRQRCVRERTQRRTPQSRRTLSLPKVGCEARMSGQNRSSTNDSRPGQSDIERASGEFGAGSGTSIPLHETTGSKYDVTGGAISAGDRMAIGAVTDSIQSSQFSLPMLSHPPLWHQSEALQHAEEPVSQRHQEPTGQVGLRGIWPTLPFVNVGNQCYINSVVSALGWAMIHCEGGVGIWHNLGLFVQAVVAQGTEQLVTSLDTFWMLDGWNHVERQNDVAEFVSHLLRKMPVAGQNMMGTWGAMQMEPFALETFRESLVQPLPLPLLQGTGPLTLQAIVDEWANTSHTQGLHAPPPEVLWVQLLRFNMVAGRVCKNRVQILESSLTSDITFPVYVVVNGEVRIRNQAYQLIAAVVHHGMSPQSGHYTAVLKMTLGWTLKNDTATSRQETLNREQEENVYLLIFKRVLVGEVMVL